MLSWSSGRTNEDWEPRCCCSWRVNTLLRSSLLRKIDQMELFSSWMVLGGGTIGTRMGNASRKTPLADAWAVKTPRIEIIKHRIRVIPIVCQPRKV